MYRKHISARTDKASLLLQLGDIPYEHAKLMTEDQIISLYQRDHNILYETGHPDRDAFWNLTHRLIAAHRDKTKQDLGIIAKGRRIRRDHESHALIINQEMRAFVRENPDRALAEAFVEGTFDGKDQANKVWLGEANRRGGVVRWAKWPPTKRKKRKIRSRGFDKTRRRKMDGTVVKR